MKRQWIGIALLSGTWLVGLSYYHAANWLAWAILLAPGVLLLSGAVRRTVPFVVAVAAAVMLLPAVAVAPWPYRAAPALLLLGLVVQVVGLPRQWPKRLGSGMIAAGVVLLVQSVAMLGYEAFTARFSDVPGPLAASAWRRS